MMDTATHNDITLLALDIGAKKHVWASEVDGHIRTGEVDNSPDALRLCNGCRRAG